MSSASAIGIGITMPGDEKLDLDDILDLDEIITQQPKMDGILQSEITHHDVLLGRGVTTNRHPGNEKFRSLVSVNKETYVTSSKRDKMMITRSIVKAVRNLDPPGRFLEKDPETGIWADVGHRRAVEKTSQALRDGASNLRKQLSEDLGNSSFLNDVFDVEMKSDTTSKKPASGKNGSKGHGEAALKFPEGVPKSPVKAKGNTKPTKELPAKRGRQRSYSTPPSKSFRRLERANVTPPTPPQTPMRAPSTPLYSMDHRSPYYSPHSNYYSHYEPPEAPRPYEHGGYPLPQRYSEPESPVAYNHWPYYRSRYTSIRRTYRPTFPPKYEYRQVVSDYYEHAVGGPSPRDVMHDDHYRYHDSYQRTGNHQEYHPGPGGYEPASPVPGGALPCGVHQFSPAATSYSEQPPPEWTPPVPDIRPRRPNCPSSEGKEPRVLSSSKFLDDREARSDYYRRYYEGEEERLITEDLSVPHLNPNRDGPSRGVVLSRRPPSWGTHPREYRGEAPESPRLSVASHGDFNPPLPVAEGSRQHYLSRNPPSYRYSTPSHAPDEPKSTPEAHGDAPNSDSMDVEATPQPEKTESANMPIKEEDLQRNVAVASTPKEDNVNTETLSRSRSSSSMKKAAYESPIFFSHEENDERLELPPSLDDGVKNENEDTVAAATLPVETLTMAMTPIPFDREDPTTLMEVPEDLLKLPISPCGPHDKEREGDGDKKKSMV